MAILNNTSKIPYGYCHCGCGQKTPLATRNRKEYNQIKNQPIQYMNGHGRKAIGSKQSAAFWNRVIITADDNQCWLWTGTLTDGYGYKQWNGKVIRTNRIAWSYPDYVIPEGMEICHSCDNPACCNPKHLWLGTKQDNMNDKVSKNRQHHPVGIKNGNCKLSYKEVCEIRKRYSEGGISQRELGIEYSVNQAHISSIILNKLRRKE